ncbi:glycosyltransferase family 1 protein [Janibacter sp. Y6]|uniref:glycosyltransferase family 1 protein n=1 Tax=Janibacter sp. Y6 TaxID=2913552 RepID=UPI0034A0F95B
MRSHRLRATGPVVRHVPRGHAYVDALVGAEPAHLHPADPPVPGAPAGQWWPHPALTPRWVADHAHEIDVLHVHFGFEHLGVDDVRHLVASLRAHDIRLVLTVHDLVDPHGTGERYGRVLGELVGSADALTTLTPGAAAEVERRFGRRPQVISHPPLVPAGVLPARRTGSPFVVGLHLKSLRANVAALPVLDACADAVAGLDDAQLRVHLHEDVTRADHPRHDPEVLRRLARARADGADVRVHAPLDDAQLWRDLAQTSLAVLPYTDGTHSGWLEMCHDLGTRVLAPDLGFYAQQRPVLTYRHDDLTASVERAVHEAHARWAQGEPAPGGDARVLAAELESARAAHREVYLGVAEDRVVRGA